MISDLLRGEKVRLCTDDPEARAAKFARWNQDTEWLRLLDTDPPRMPSEKKWKEWLEKELDREMTHDVFFSIHTLDKDELIGFIGLFDLFQQHGDALVAIALGERDYWGQGFGTDAMRVLLRYAFNELNLHRVGLIVFEYNLRAMRSYEKAGFIPEGRIRGAILREGRRWDWIYMGLLRDEWLANGIMTS
ncbi:MAG: GNAT family N-acetyltransferase [Acidobacteriaceae bacterium]